ncbi:MAG TPA: helix-turn-helix transcriptional regulator [Gaiellaceae bacterium]|nr:helix-turn-helix transcriptional regulator [Gaiellaceae bacterium]
MPFATPPCGASITSWPTASSTRRSTPPREPAPRGAHAVPALTVAVPVGNRLRALRKERGMTIPQLAAATGLTNGFISQLERDLTSAVALVACARPLARRPESRTRGYNPPRVRM